jgi:hypothetical protein
MLRTVNRMAYGTGPDEVRVGERVSWALAPIAVSLILLILFGLGLPPGFIATLGRVAALVSPRA